MPGVFCVACATREIFCVACATRGDTMSGLLYYLVLFAESVTSVFGYRGAYEQPRYVVIQPIGPQAEIRLYEPRVAVQVTIHGDNRDQAAGEAFRLLFAYIAGANRAGEKIAMTTPVGTQAGADQPPGDAAPGKTSPAPATSATPPSADQDGERIAMTAPVQTTSEGGTVTMRFFLPHDVAQRGAPAPNDPRLRIVAVPQTTLAVLRFSGADSQALHQRKAEALLRLLAASDWKPQGPVFRLNYDPPFTIPALRRNEAAVVVTR